MIQELKLMAFGLVVSQKLVKLTILVKIALIASWRASVGMNLKDQIYLKLHGNNARRAANVPKIISKN